MNSLNENCVQCGQIIIILKRGRPEPQGGLCRTMPDFYAEIYNSQIFRYFQTSRCLSLSRPSLTDFFKTELPPEPLCDLADHFINHH